MRYKDIRENKKSLSIVAENFTISRISMYVIVAFTIRNFF